MSIIAPDYNILIDKQTWAFIVKTQNAYPDNAAQLSIAEQRTLYDTMCETFRVGYPDTVIATDSRIESSFYQSMTSATPPDSTDSGCLCRHYRSQHCDNAPAQILYFHGGGFVVGSLESHDDICAEIAHATTLPVTSVDYRLLPEHQHPAAFDDAYAAVLHAWHSQNIPLILVGDSAGGNLAASLCHSLRGSSIPIMGQVLMYPGLGGNMECGSYLTHANAPMLTTEEVRFYADIRGNGISAMDPTLAPLRDTDFNRLPPTVIISAACDPLSDDGKHYQQIIVESGGIAHWINEAGLVHGYLRARHSVDRARHSFDRMLAAIIALSREQWPY